MENFGKIPGAQKCWEIPPEKYREETGRFFGLQVQRMISMFFVGNFEG